MNSTLPLKFVSSNRRVREDRRFVVGQGRYAADVALEGLLHVALLPSQHPAARIVSINAIEAMKMPGVHYVLTGEELARATEPLMNGLDTPQVRRFPLAVGQATAKLPPRQIRTLDRPSSIASIAATESWP